MLAGLLSKQDKELDRSSSAPALKRQRIEEGEDIFQTLAQTLHEMRAAMLTKNIPDLTKLEVEMRVGMLVDRNRRWKSHHPSGGAVVANDKTVTFKSGIDDIIADRLKGILTMEGYNETVLKPERLRFNEAGDIRRVVDDAGNAIGMAEAKDKFLRRDIACLGHNYDIRLDVASELPIQTAAPSSSEASVVWHVERLKRRVRYSMAERAWQIDVTEVETTKLVGAEASRVATPTIELEFELVPAALARWLHCAEADVFIATSKIATELLHVLDLCVPSGATESSHTGISGTITPTAEVLSAMSAITTRIRRSNTFGDVGGSGSGRTGLDFMGCMPLNISRRNMKTLQQNKYFVTEKSDGVRYLLFVLPAASVPSVAASAGVGVDGAVAVLMDRSPKLYLPVGAADIGSALGIGTVVDGEIVVNLHTKQSVFLIFDVLSLDGSPCSQLPFEQRLDSLQGPLSSRIASLTARQQQQPDQQPLRLVEKRFVPKSELRSLLGKMGMKNGHRVYQDRENKWRCHKSDGLIFQPNLPYLFSTDINLIKWKWPELTSIDLNAILVNEPGNSAVGLLALGSDGSMVDCTMRGRSRVGLGPFDTLRLRADIEDSTSPASIAEVAYCPQFGLWTYFHMRPDKTTPNFINTALSILMEQAEAISIEELEYRLLARNEAENDFSKQMAKMTAKALQFQRERCGHSSQR